VIPDRCREFDEGLHSISTRGLKAWGAWVAGFANAEDCIAAGLEQSCQDGDWGSFDLYVFAASQHPSPSFTRPLCGVLSRRIDEVNNEDIVDALAEIRDPAAVGCLEETIWWEPEWDEYRGLAIKAVWALAAIGTPEAIAVLRDTASSADERTRQFAAHALSQTAHDEPL